jgi:hypothetical protein
MEYDAITLDTNIFDQNGLYLEGGMLKQMNQFAQGSVQFVLSEIVIRELHKHLTEEAQQAKDALTGALKKSTRTALLAETAISTGMAPRQRLGASCECELLWRRPSVLKTCIQDWIEDSAWDAASDVEQ